jgi:hypothetical protein
MANAVVPRWHGDNYQSRFFWIHAASLLDPERPEVVEVTFEADGPKAFDDVVIRYDPGRPRASGPGRVTVDYHQIKWHADSSGRFGFKDLIDPGFIGATSVSILQRLKAAKTQAGDGAAFHLITTDRVTDGDPLSELISPADGSLRLQVLEQGKTDGSRMGEVRKTWRDHLELASDDELFALLDGFHIIEGYDTLERLRHQVSLHFRLVGLVGAEDETAFVYDEAARQLVIKKVNKFDRTSFRDWCEGERWFLPKRPEPRRSIAIQTYPPRPTPEYMRDASPDCTLDLTSSFEDRHLRADVSWNEIKAPIVDFLKARLKERPQMRLFLETHASVATLAGSALRFKDGADVEIVQRGERNPGMVWSSNDGLGGDAPVIETETIGEGRDIAVAVGLSRDPMPKVREYVGASLSEVGTILKIIPAGGPGQSAINGGEHAAAIAASIADAVTAIGKPGATVHLFVSAPNAFSFFLGQQAEAMGTCVPYEFDFSSQFDGSYRPTFKI